MTRELLSSGLLMIPLLNSVKLASLVFVHGFDHVSCNSLLYKLEYPTVMQIRGYLPLED